jgi:outer membrane protein assembly factor BamB
VEEAGSVGTGPGALAVKGELSVRQCPPEAIGSIAHARRSTRIPTAAVTALVAFAVAVLSAPAARGGTTDDGAWTQLGSDPGRTSFAWDETTLARSVVHGLHVAWVQDTGSGGFDGIAAPPVVADGVVYALSSGSFTSAFDAHTGSPLWGNTQSCPMCWTPAAPALAGNVLIATVSPAFSQTGSSAMSGIDLSDQSTLWTAVGSGAWTASPAVVGSVLYVGYPDCCSGHGGVEARDTATGARLWFSSDGDPYGSPVVGEGVVLSGPNALKQGNGKLLWTSPGFEPAVISHGHAYGTCDGLVCAVDIGTGQARWTASGTSATWLAMANRVLVASGPSGLTALNPMTGAVRWNDPAPSGAVSMADGVVYASNGSVLTATNVRNGQQLVSVDLGTPLTQPVIVDGFVYVGGQNGTLYALTV